MDFTERFKTYSNKELLKVIENQNDYQLEAVETAKKIFESRQIDDTEYENIKLELEAQKQSEESRLLKQEAFKKKQKGFLLNLFNSINPIQSKKISSNNLVNLIGVIFLLIGVFNLIRGLSFIRLFFIDDSAFAYFDISFFSTIIFLIIIPIAGFFFILKKKTGWALLTIYLTYAIISQIANIIMIYRWREEFSVNIGSLFPEPSPSAYIWRLFFYLGVLIVICKKDIREIFKVDKIFTITTIGVFGLLTMLAYYKILF